MMKLDFEVANPTTSENDLYPIILIHAVLDSKKSWKVVAPQIANGTGRKVYYVDARNHGTSPWSKDFTIQLMADDIKEFLNEHTISQAILVGSCMGGSVAMQLALEAPELIEKLVVENMVPNPFPTFGWEVVVIEIVMLRTALREIPEGSDLIAAKKAIASYASTYLPNMPPNRNHEFGLQVMPLKEENGEFKWEANLDEMEVAVTNEDFDVGLSGIYGGEALFLYGAKSNMNVGDNEQIPVLFPRAARVPVPGATHMVHVEVPEKFVEHVVQFINGQSSPESNFESKT